MIATRRSADSFAYVVYQRYQGIRPMPVGFVPNSMTRPPVNIDTCALAVAIPQRRRSAWHIFRVLRGLAVLSLMQPAFSAAAPLDDCILEPSLSKRQDVVFCEGWESSDWWRNGYLKSASVSQPVVANASHVANTQVITDGCVSGSCLRVEMKQYQSGALSVFWPLKAAGAAPDELYLRYYLKLGDNFDPKLCSHNGKSAGSGGKFPGLADVRSYPEKQCGNGGEFADGLRCWSMRGFFRNCNRGERHVTHACLSPTASTRFGSYLYYFDQAGFQNAGIWDGEQWGQGHYSRPFGSCGTPRDVGGCGKGTAGQLENGRWYLIEMQVKMNSPGKPDGMVRGWIDGKLSYEKTNMIWRLPGHENLHVRTIWLNIHAGGEMVGLCSPSYVILDQLVAATGERPGPAGP